MRAETGVFLKFRREISRRKTCTTTARLLRVRISEDKSLSIQSVSKIDNDSFKKKETLWVDEELNTQHLDDLVLVFGLVLERKFIGQSRAAATNHRNTQ